MYETFYGLKERPFSLLPDPSFLYLGRRHSLAYSVLEYGVRSQAGFTVITGEVGCGKTTLVRHLLNHLSREVTVGLITNTAGASAELLKWVLFAFRQDYKNKETVQLYEIFEDFLIREYAAGRRTVLIVDEAQNLGLDTLEELRMLSNINADKDLVLQLILVGQPQLKHKLELPQLSQFAQRIAVSYHLAPLTEPETTEYIRHRLTHVGGDPALFSPEASAAIHRESGGVPRLINVLCDTALVYGYAGSAPAIGLELLEEVIRDRSAGVRQAPSNADPRPTEPQPQAVPEDRTVTPFDRDMARELFSTLRKK